MRARLLILGLLGLLLLVAYGWPVGAAPVASGLNIRRLPDGTSGAPIISFASEPTLGFFRATSGRITAQASGGFLASAFLRAATVVQVAGGNATLNGPSDGNLTVTNFAATIGSQLKVDALPTVSAGFGTGAAITAGSTPLAGSIAVGTTAGTGGVIAFNGTAYPSSPFVLCMNSTTTQAIRCTANTTTLTVTSAALTDNDVVMWHAISSK